jgi:hypothetical protein
MSNQQFERSRGGKPAGSTPPHQSSSGSSRQQQSETPSTIISEVQGALDQQVVRGARVMSDVARSARRAADELQNDTPQIAGVVRGMANRVEEYSRDLENQTASNLYQSASEFTRRQPALVFGLAALAGFIALRTVKNSQTSSASRTGRSRPGSEDYYGA